MATAAVSAKGIKLGVRLTASSDPLWFKEVKSVPEVGTSPDKIDATSLDSDVKESIKDIPYFSGDLDFVMNAQPYKASVASNDESNLNLIRSLGKNSTYTWVIVYPKLNLMCEIIGEWTWKMGAGAPSSVMEATVSIIPKSRPIWTKLTATYDVIYDVNTGTGTAPTDSNSPYTGGTEVTTLGPGSISKEGYTFSGWNTMADGKGASYDESDTFVIVENTTLYAQWTKDL
ncbi:MAG: hypothetical protein E7Z65_06415 [Thermoplasmata archaeon]|nr:hypothetical protein [Thermoplasmata archaeon]